MRLCRQVNANSQTSWNKLGSSPTGPGASPCLVLSRHRLTQSRDHAAAGAKLARCWPGSNLALAGTVVRTFECPKCERVLLAEDDPIRSHMAWLNSIELRPPD